MKDMGWLLLLGAGGFILYEMFYGSGSTTGVTTTTGGTSASTSPQGADVSNTTAATQTTSATNPTTNNSPTPSLSQIIALMQQYNQDPTQNQYSQYVYETYWNMLASQANQNPSSASLTALGSGTLPIATWWAAMQQGGLAGLGRIANNVNPYYNGPGHVSLVTPYGQGIKPTWAETLTTWKGQS